VAKTTPAKHLDAFKWEPGKSGNPKGRPKGSRNKLGEAFVSAMQDDFLEHGPTVIQQVRTEKPADYLKIIASILPKEFKIERIEDDLTDEQFDAILGTLAAALEQRGIDIGDAPTHSVEGTA